MRIQIIHFRSNTLIETSFLTLMTDYKAEEMVTEKVFTTKKLWLEKYNDKKKGVKQNEKTQNKEVAERAKINMPCKKCDSKQMYYYTMQTRSADEGQTIFYECVKCG